MQLEKAIDFCAKASFSDYPQKWVDLGSGKGLFTDVLARFLPPSSTITAVDKKPQKLSSVQSDGVKLRFLQADIKDELPLKQLDGILMANSLHYIADKKQFLLNTIASHGPIKNFILIEYDTHHPNPWIPHPLPFAEAEELFNAVRMPIKKLNERTSLYGHKKMYLAQYSPRK